ncbi:MAG: hypothetical protein WCF79_18950, partial [Rhodomicrobium sp.]
GGSLAKKKAPASHKNIKTQEHGAQVLAAAWSQVIHVFLQCITQTAKPSSSAGATNGGSTLS